MRFKVTGQITVSCYTYVEAEDEKQAKLIAEGREKADIMILAPFDPEEQWFVDELDGEAEDLEVERED